MSVLIRVEYGVEVLKTIKEDVDDLFCRRPVSHFHEFGIISVKPFFLNEGNGLRGTVSLVTVEQVHVSGDDGFHDAHCARDWQLNKLAERLDALAASRS